MADTWMHATPGAGRNGAARAYDVLRRSGIARIPGPDTPSADAAGRRAGACDLSGPVFLEPSTGAM